MEFDFFVFYSDLSHFHMWS